MTNMTKQTQVRSTVEAMKLALDALWTTANPKAEEAIIALREALAQERSSDEQPAQQEPVAWMSDNDIGFKKSEFGATPTVPLYTDPPPQRKPLTDDQINWLINGRGDEEDDDYVEPTGDGFGLTDADLVRLVRRVEAAHNIKEKNSD